MSILKIMVLSHSIYVTVIEAAEAMRDLKKLDGAMAVGCYNFDLR
jgi:hypothetical protein